MKDDYQSIYNTLHRVYQVHRENHPENSDNDNYIHKAAAQCTNVIVAWGEDGGHLGRDQEIIRLLKTHFPQIYCLGKTVGGQPRQPRRLQDSCEPELFLTESLSTKS